MNEIFIVLIGVVVGAMLTIARDLFNEHRAKKKCAMYLALKVTNALDQFAKECTEVAGDDGHTQGCDERGCAVVRSTCPQIDLYALDVDWQSLPFYLMHEILNLQTEIASADSLIRSVSEYIAYPPDYDEYFEERQYQYASLGLLANKLSNNLRHYYKIPKKHCGRWDPIEYLEQKKHEIEKYKNAREKYHTDLQKNA